MKKNRLEAFSDGVFAIILTIMVLELKVPEGFTLDALKPQLPVFLAYVLSFANVGIYWNNHHHLIYSVKYINGGVLWANLHLLFWLSLMPFTTGWMGEHHTSQGPVLVYGIVLLMNGISYTILQACLMNIKENEKELGEAFRVDVKGKVSVALYVIGILASFDDPRISLGLYVVVAAMWFIPDRRIEKKIVHPES